MNKTLFQMMGLSPSLNDACKFIGRISCEHCMVEEATDNMWVPHEKTCECIVYFNIGEEFTSPVKFVDLPEGCIIVYEECDV